MLGNSQCLIQFWKEKIEIYCGKEDSINAKGENTSWLQICNASMGGLEDKGHMVTCDKVSNTSKLFRI